MTLSDALSAGRSSNLDGLRLILAMSVIFSHAWPLALGPGTAEPLEQLTGLSLGGWAVLLFFFLSGLLVTASAQRRSLVSFGLARVRRIFPGLAVALLVSLVLAYASGATAEPDEALAWFARAFTLVSIEHRLTAAFDGNPFPHVLNGPLWSLFHEVAAYVVCVALVRAGLAGGPKRVLAVATVVGFATLAGPDLPARLSSFLPLFFAFMLGMTAHALRHALPLTPSALAVWLVAALLLPDPLAMAAVCFAVLTAALCLPRIGLDSDYSFGLYIYGWPVAQFAVHLLPGIDPIALALLSLSATFPLAWFSWHIIEQPAMWRLRQLA